MAKLVLILTIDTDRPVGPQLACAAGHGFKLEVLSRFVGYTPRHIRRLIEMSGFWDRQAVVFRVEDAPVDKTPPVE